MSKYRKIVNHLNKLLVLPVFRNYEKTWSHAGIGLMSVEPNLAVYPLRHQAFRRSRFQALYIPL